MILVDIDVPKTCRECPMSCQINWVNEETQRIELQILCRVDWRQHKPLDRNCPILGRLVSNDKDYTDEPWVRCKDCKYLEVDFVKNITSFNMNMTPVTFFCTKLFDEYTCWQQVESDDFCSWGVRKDND